MYWVKTLESILYGLVCKWNKRKRNLAFVRHVLFSNSYKLVTASFKRPAECDLYLNVIFTVFWMNFFLYKSVNDQIIHTFSSFFISLSLFVIYQINNNNNHHMITIIFASYISSQCFNRFYHVSTEREQNKRAKTKSNSSIQSLKAPYRLNGGEFRNNF